LRAALLALCAAGLLVPALAAAHLERPSYWPDPAADKSVSPPAGGKVPKARSLASAVTGRGPGEVRVVCKRSSLKLAKRSIRRAQRRGFRLRPSLPKRKISASKARKLRRINRVLFRRCDFKAVQKAVTRSRNNDRIVIMPGRYTEPKSRRSPVNDPKCNPGLLQDNQSGDSTPSYEYQATCPNDQNLIHVAGRAIKGDPAPIDADRHGIPDQELGRCIRCNLQIEGSGPRPEDVILDAGRGYKNPKRPQARPGGTRSADECHPPSPASSPCFGKHVVMRTDRSDGFVGRNFLVRGALEHGFYTEETDGILLDRVKFFWNRDYGHLSFTTDHNVIKNCDGFGSGDAVVYPGASPQTGEFRDESVYPDARYNTVIKRCDLHGSAMGYSGSMGNSVRVTQNRFYGNANGLTSDTLSAPGHPGFPADGMKIDRNWFYSNNLDVYRDDPPFEPLVPQPVGSGIVWAGYNDGIFEGNRVFDNWRQGTMLLAVPDALAGDADGNKDDAIHCELTAISSTSCDNQYFDNKMGAVPAGFKPHPGLRKFGNQSGLLDPGTETELPNGVDFWWDEFPGNDGNCWFDNTGADGTAGSIDSDPAGLLLPSACGPTSVGLGNAAKEAVLLSCFVAWEEGETDLPSCTWFDTPPRPETMAARTAQREQARADRRWARSDTAERLEEYMDEYSGQLGLGPQQ
jgi:hypothetical protein